MKKTTVSLLIFGFSMAGCVGGEVSTMPTQLTLEGKLQITEGAPMTGGGVHFTVRSVGHGDLSGVNLSTTERQYRHECGPGDRGNFWHPIVLQCSEINVMLNGTYQAEAGYLDSEGQTSLEYSGAWGHFDAVNGCSFDPILQGPCVSNGGSVVFGSDMRLYISATAQPTPDRCRSFCGESDAVCQDACLAAATIDFAEVPVAVIDPEHPEPVPGAPGDPEVPVVPGETRYVFDLIATGYSPATP